MKTQVLSIEQMQRLKELGVDTSKASMRLERWRNKPSNKDATWKYEWAEWEIKIGYNPCMDKYSDYQKEPTFTLQDILEILPKNINDYELNWNMSNSTLRYDRMCSCDRIETLEKFDIIYDDSTSFIDAAYDMIVLIAENGYFKQK